MSDQNPYKDPVDFKAADLANPSSFVSKLQTVVANMRFMLGYAGPNRGTTAWDKGFLDRGITDPGDGGGGGGGGGGPPPPPTGFSVGAAISHIFVECDAQGYTQGGGHDHSNVYGAKYPGTGPLPTFANAVIIDTFQGNFVAIPSDPHTEWHLWLTWVSHAGVESAPAGGTNGQVATTGEDVTNLLDALTEAAEDPGSPYSKIFFRADLFYIGAAGGSFEDIPFFVNTTTIVVNGQTVPPGVYMRDVFIENGTIDSVKIGIAAIDEANIATCNVDSLKAGSIQLGEYIKSSNYVAGLNGWRIDGNGNAEFNTVTVRGTIVATAGEIGGASINSTGVQSSGYLANTSGWRLDNASGMILAASIKVRNAAGTRIFDLTATGTGVVFKVDSAIEILANGTATFGGTLTAPNIIDTPQIVPSAVTNSGADTNHGGVITAGATVTVATVTDTFLGSGTPVLILAGVRINTTATAQVEVIRDSTTLETITIGGDVVLTFPPYRDAPATGSHTYHIDITALGGVGTSYTNAGVFFLEMKR